MTGGRITPDLTEGRRRQLQRYCTDAKPPRPTQPGHLSVGI